MFNCIEHHKTPQTWTGDCENCIKYDVVESLGSGRLPSQKQILEYLITTKSNNTGKHINTERQVAMDVALVWISCNIYPKRLDNEISNMIKTIYKEYEGLKKKANSNKSDYYWEKFGKFTANQKQLFDILGN